MSRASVAHPLAARTITQSPGDGTRGARDDASLRGAASLSAASAVTSSVGRPALASSAAGENIRHDTYSHTYTPNDHGPRSGDVLNSADSDSSIPSSASSVFSSTMSGPGRNPPLHALTPLTSTDSSPPGKLPSPRSAKPSHETMLATTLTAPLSASAKNATDTITPVHTPPEARISIWPADGKLGQRLNYDPMLDTKLDKKAKHSRGPIYKPILDKVREGHTHTHMPWRGSSCDARLT